jgi:hypothetical protein
MRLPIPALFCVAIGGTVQSQTPSQTIDSYVSAAKVAAGTEWAGTFLRLCVPPPVAAADAPAGDRAIPARETWAA